MSKNETSQGLEAHYDTLIQPVITEKSTIASENNQVVFLTPLTASKPQISEAVEALFQGQGEGREHNARQRQEQTIPRSRLHAFNREKSNRDA